MNTLYLQTHIKAPIQACFDLSRSIDLHLESTVHTHEKAIAGKTSGLIGLNETVTWQAKHFGIYWKMTVQITAFEVPNYFRDEMVKGPFKTMRHEHFFEGQSDGSILMKDVFTFASPMGILGGMVDKLYLEGYMRKFLEKRNEVIKAKAEENYS
ncbi:MAG: SRPBCC family protein [Chitinophagales bacterium]